MSPADSSSIWMQSETSLPIHIQTSNPESAPAMFVENIFHAPGAAAGHHPHIHASTGAYGYPMAMKTRSTGINMMSSVFPQDQERPRQRKKRQMTTPEDAQYQCNKCGKLFKREWNFSKHEETHDPNRPRPHICSYGNCKDAFARRTDLVRHMNGVS